MKGNIYMYMNKDQLNNSKINFHSSNAIKNILRNKQNRNINLKEITIPAKCDTHQDLKQNLTDRAGYYIKEKNSAQLKNIQQNIDAQKPNKISNTSDLIEQLQQTSNQKKLNDQVQNKSKESSLTSKRKLICESKQIDEKDLVEQFKIFDNVIKNKQNQLQQEQEKQKSLEISQINNYQSLKNEIIKTNQESLKNLHQQRTKAFQPCYSKENENILMEESNIENYEFLEVLGFGSYAIVRLAKHKPSELKVAIKSYEKKSLQDPSKLKNVQREIKILSKLRHPNIIRLFQVLESANQVHLVMEYMKSLPLNQFMQMKQDQKIKEEEAQIIIYQLADSLKYCHSKYVVHRDIKLENILIGSNLRLKLIDFGFAVVVPPQTYLNCFCGTPSYMSPEIVNKQDYTYHVDIWALGILLFKMCGGHFPFKGQTDAELYRKINTCRPDFPEHFSHSLVRLIQNIIKFSPSERIQLTQILQDEWITDGQPQNSQIQQKKKIQLKFVQKIQ